jgi:intracellular multiplication protein IcmL
MNSLKKFFNNLFATADSKKDKDITEKGTDHALNDDIELDFEECSQKTIENEKHFQSILLSMQENTIVQKLGKAAIKLNLVLSGIIFLLLIYSAVVTWYAVHPVREYFAADNGRILKLVPLSEPHQKNQSVIQFVKDSLNESFTIDFLNYKKQLENARPFFTDRGFASFLSQLKKSGILDTVIEKRMNLYVSTGTGILKQKGVTSGRYYWIVQIPVEIKLTGQTTELPAQKLIASVKVERVDVLDSVVGIAITQLVTKPNK